MTVDSIIQKTSEYLGVPSVVGHEGYFMRYLQGDFEKLGFNTEIHSGLLVVYGEKPLSTIVSAHIDRLGLISTGNGEYEYASHYLYETKYDKDVAASQELLEAIRSRFEGEAVYAYDSESGKKLGNGTITGCTQSMSEGDSIFLLHDMPPEPENTPIAYARPAEKDGELFKGQLDNTISLGALYTLCRNGFEGTVLLSTEEEIGRSWIHISNWLGRNNIETKELIIIDTSPYPDDDQIDDGLVVLRERDKSAVFNLELLQKIEERCQKLALPYHLKDHYLLSQGKDTEQLGSTELGKLIMQTNNRWSGATIQIPTIMYHTSYETTTRQSIENFYTLLENVLIKDPLTI